MNFDSKLQPSFADSVREPLAQSANLSCGNARNTCESHSQITSPKPKVSVIVPVYKVEKYLRACIDSILAQTFTDFELILVDDGSPDNCGAICDEYAQKDARIRVFHKENGGVSSARNLGIERSRGEWIAFVDSDDTVSPHYLANLYGNAPEKDCLVFSGMKRVTEAGKITGYLRFVPATMSVKQAFAEKTLENWGYPFSKLYNREIIMRERVRFDEEIKLAEDLCFLFDYLLFVSKIIFRDCCEDYIYITHTGSASFKYYDFDSEWKLFLHTNKIQRFFRGEKEFSSAFWRALTILYRPHSVFSRSERLKRLKKCYLEGKKCGAGFVGRTWRQKIFAAGYLKTFDFIESILFGLRYGVLNFAWQFYVKLKNQMNNKIKIQGGVKLCLHNENASAFARNLKAVSRSREAAFVVLGNNAIAFSQNALAGTGKVVA